MILSANAFRVCQLPILPLPVLVLRALSFVSHGGTYFPRSAVAHWPFPDATSLKACSLVQSPAGATPASGGIGGYFPNPPARAERRALSLGLERDPATIVVSRMGTALLDE
jgi:hypothetical protein